MMKSTRRKVREKTLSQHEIILSAMKYDKWYKTSDFEEILGVKQRRIQVLLKELVQNGDLIDNGKIKGKRYKKV